MTKRNINTYTQTGTHCVLSIVSNKTGKVTEFLIDNEDIELCKRYSWSVLTIHNKKSTKIYAQACAGSILLHRVIHGLAKGNPLQIDHVHNTQDNRKAMTRVCTRSENLRNCQNVIGYTKTGNKYRAQVYVDAKPIRLGTYNTPQEARQAYIDAKLKYHDVVIN